MNEHFDIAPKYDAAIQVRVCGRDLGEHQFEEISTSFPSSRGVMLETIHELQEGAALEITDLLNNRTEIVKVKCLGPKLGASTLVFVEGAGIENFWAKGAGEAPDHKQNSRNGDGTNTDITTAGSFLAIPEHALVQSPKTRFPNFDQFANALNVLVESSLEANLRPAVEHLTSAIPEHVARAQHSVFAKFEEQMQVALATFGNRLDIRAQEVLANNEHALTQKVRQSIDEGEQLVQSRLNEFNETLERASRLGKENLTEQVQAVLSGAVVTCRNRIHEQCSQVETQLAERCQQEAENKQNSISARAHEIEFEILSRLTAKIDTVLNDFSTELQTRADRAMVAVLETLQKRADAIALTVAERTHQVESTTSSKLQQQADEIAGRSRSELEDIFGRNASLYTEQFREQLASTTTAFRQTFISQIDNELIGKQEAFVHRTQTSIDDLAIQNQKRIAGLLKELAAAIESRLVPMPETVQVNASLK